MVENITTSAPASLNMRSGLWRLHAAPYLRSKLAISEHDQGRGTICGLESRWANDQPAGRTLCAVHGLLPPLRPHLLLPHRHILTGR